MWNLIIDPTTNLVFKLWETADGVQVGTNKTLYEFPTKQQCLDEIAALGIAYVDGDNAGPKLVSYATLATILGLLPAAALKLVIKEGMANALVIPTGPTTSVTIPVEAFEILDQLLCNFGGGIDFTLAESIQFLQLFVADGKLAQLDAAKIIAFAQGSA